VRSFTLPLLSDQSLQLSALALEPVHWPAFARAGVHCAILRLDKLHPLWGGNKIYKLRLNLCAARDAGFERVLSFGGAWSNHLFALAAIARELGMASVGIVRGDESRTPSATLRDLSDMGMTLRMVSREHYRYCRSVEGMQTVQADYPDCWVIPEGGDNALGFEGCRTLGQALLQFESDTDRIALGVGTGTTIAGVIAGLQGRIPVLGVLAARDSRRVSERIAARIGSNRDVPGDWSLTDAYVGPGFGRLSQRQSDFWNLFERQTGITLDPIYTLKLMHALASKAEQGEYVPGTRLLAIHTGGLQGRRGFPQQPTRYNELTDSEVHVK